MTVNHAAVNSGLHVPSQTSVFFSLNIWSGVESVVLFLSLKNPHTAFHNDCINLHSHQQCTKLPFSPHTCQHIICGVFDGSHSDKCEVITHCGFHLHFSDD